MLQNDFFSDVKHMLRFAIGMDSLLTTVVGAGVNFIKTSTNTLNTDIATQTANPLLLRSIKQSRFRVLFTSSM
jgi:hypothetical protein